MLNTKFEIQDALVELCSVFSKKSGVRMEVRLASSVSLDSLYEEDAPPANLAMMAEEEIDPVSARYLLDLSSQPWAGEADKLARKAEGKIYGFPFCVEGKGWLYNQTAAEAVLGTEFDPGSLHTLKDFENLLKLLQKKGMEKPLIFSNINWSLGTHLLNYFYETQDFTREGSGRMVQELRKGTVETEDNPRFRQLCAAVDRLKGFNRNDMTAGESPYMEDARHFASGEAAFWFSGNWAWPNIVEAGGKDMKLGILPFFLSDDPEDEANQKICISVSKYLTINTAVSTERQQEAALEFLNWLVTDETAKSMMVENLALISPFTSNGHEPSEPLGIGVEEYFQSGKTFSSVREKTNESNVMGNYVREYFLYHSREELATAIEAYWLE